MARNDLPKLIAALEKVAVAVGHEGPRQACEQIISNLQQEGPSWSGRFSNSWLIQAPSGLPGSIKGDGQKGEPRSIKKPAPAAQGLAQKVTSLGQTVFVINNFSDWSSQAVDKDAPDGFFRPTEKPETALGQKKWEVLGPREKLRGQLRAGKDGASRTAKLFWFQSYNDGGKRDEVIASTLSKALRRIR